MEQLLENAAPERKTARKRRIRRIILLLTAFLVLAIGGLAVYIAFGIEHMLFEAVYPEREFVSEVWKESGPIIRASMVKDLLESFDFEGMTVEEVQSLLGKADRESEYLDSNGRKRTTMEYKLDRGVRDVFWPFGEPYYQFVCFEFDADGRFTGVNENN